MKNLIPLKKNSIALFVCALMLVLTALMMLLPVHEFSTAVFSKKSGNTFVGDERYVKAYADVQAAADAYENAQIKETVTERVNSKGVTTSMVAWDVVVQQKLTGAQLITKGFASSWVLAGVLVCEGAAMILLLATMNQSDMMAEHRRLSRRARILRTGAAWLCLAALILAVVFPMAANLDFSRKPELIADGFGGADTAALLSKYDALLFGGAAGDGLTKLLGSVSTTLPWTYWLLLPVLLIATLGYVMLAKGEIGPAIQRGALYLFVIALCIVVLYPFYVMFITGFRSNAETTDMHFLHLFPTEWVWSNIPDIIARGVPRYLLNSILLSTGATLIAMVCGIPAAYAMARMNFKGKKAFLGFVIMSQMFSPVVLLVGISQLMNTLHLNDSIVGLMLINAAFNQAFAIWLLRGTFVSISSEMEQAACIDGCNSVSALIRILLPMAAPGIVTTLIFVFINAWNEYTISTILITTPENKPITVGITQFSSFNMIEWHYLFAAALIATIPVVVLFMCIEKHLVSGLTSGGVKG